LVGDRSLTNRVKLETLCGRDPPVCFKLFTPALECTRTLLYCTELLHQVVMVLYMMYGTLCP
jgi:hypothetical protein